VRVGTIEALGLPGIEQDLLRLEPLLASSVTTGDPFLDQVTTHLIAAGGKRLRPRLALTSATGGDSVASEASLLGGVAVELVHLASLYHDDVIDEATMRRSVESVNSRFGNLTAIFAGDYLLARAAQIAAGLGHEIAGLLASTLGLLCQGQIAEVRGAFRTTRTTAEYVEAITGKTAALMSTSCRIGAITGGAPRDEVEALTEFGQNFGMVFQLRDDILDVVANEEDLGKPGGQDLAEGIYTYPVLVALADADIGPELSLLLGQQLDQPERAKARSMVAASPGVAATVAMGRGYVDAAVNSLRGVRSDPLAANLTGLVESLLDGLPVQGSGLSS
jgi:heptaprenyl diphosphate synthase